MPLPVVTNPQQIRSASKSRIPILFIIIGLLIIIALLNPILTLFMAANDNVQEHYVLRLPTTHNMILEEKTASMIKDDVVHNDANISITENEAVTIVQYSNSTAIIELPKPTDLIEKQGGKVIMKPIYGTHRRDADAVLALAAGYDYVTIRQFVGSLLDTGYDGDIVLATQLLEEMEPLMKDYLLSSSVNHLILYHLDLECHKQFGASQCKFKNVYDIVDPRINRPVATSRFELYWLWAQNYNPHSQLMLLDSRDVMFQSNPFQHLEKTSSSSNNGILRLYLEHAAIKDSEYNSRWIRKAYGQDLLNKVQNQTIICSGTTIGEKAALDAYARAMVHDFDSHQCIANGCDQGTHNMLYYGHKLDNLKGISQIHLYKQGRGIINNLGGLRDIPLRERGILDVENNYTVKNWDGSISPVVHQFDRDKELNDINKKRRRVAGVEASKGNLKYRFMDLSK